MNIDYQWSFSNFVSVTDKDFPGNIIVSVNYQITARSGAALASTSGHVSFPEPELADFVPFQNVTNDNLQQWVQSALGSSAVAGIYAGLAETIVKQLAKPNKQLPNSFKMS